MKALVLTLQPKTSIKLPFAHMEMVQGLLYKLLAYNNEFSTEVHNRQIDNHSVYKLFCFSDIQGKYKLIDGGIEFFDELKWEIRSADDRVIETILETVFTHRNFSLNNCPFTVSRIKFNNVYFDEQQMCFEMKTPAVAYVTTEGSKTVYFSPTDEQFYEIVESNLRNKYYMLFGEEYNGDFSLECSYCPEKYKRVTKYKSTIINAWLGKFSLTAEPAMLFTAYYCGIGSKNSMGFGMITAES